MPKETYISKSLVKNIVTFLNEYIDNPHIICEYTKYPNYIDISIQIWDLSDPILGKNIDCFMEHIDSKTDLDLIKIKIKEKIDKALGQLKEK